MSNEKLAMSKRQDCREQRAKLGNIIFLFSLLFSLFSFVSCPNTAEPEYPPAGMGWLRLEIEEVRLARTVLPPNSPAKFTKYRLDFFDSDGNEHERVIRKGERVTLPLGIYDLSVTAYTDSALKKEAAWGESVEKIEIKREETAVARIILKGVMEGGEGTFSWKINYPGNVVAATMTIASWQPNGMPEKTLYFIGGTPETRIGKNDTITLDAGLYRIVISLLRSNSYSIEYRETVHVYTNMDSLLEQTFVDNQFTYIIVTNGKDDDSLGSLRKAVADAKPDSSIIIDTNKVETIMLKKRLEINKKLVIEGCGVTVERDPSWTDIEDKPQLLYVGGGDVTIRRVMFKDNNIYAEGAAVYNKATLALESCIFSGNSNNNKDTSFVYHGGAVYSDRGSTLSVKGCTFYGNIAGGSGGAVAVYTDAGLTLVGNLFYGNFQNYGTAVHRVGDGDVSGSYNAETVPISPPDFRPSSGAANVIISRPEDYPFYDFYGKDIPDNNAAAGAVQP
jgi:hypothetical protein